jgi:hypothetical protein
MFKAMSPAVRPEDEEDDVDVPVEVVKVGRQRGRAAARLTVRRSAPTDRRGLAAGRPTRGVDERHEPDVPRVHLLHV